MSRVAEALQKAGQAERRAGVGRAIEAVSHANVEISAIPVPWDVEYAAPSAPDSRHTVARPNVAVSAAYDEGSAEFVELVQRVFRPSTGKPVARSVTFVSLGLVGSRRPVALEVARTLAGHGAGSVCLVDASFGAAALHEEVGLPVGPGLCDALLGGRPAQSLAVSLGQQLWMVPAGEQMCAGSAWLPEALAGALRQLAAQFDFVIVEAPSLDHDLGMSTLLTVAPLTDGVVLVVEAERTRRDVAADVVGRLRASGVSVLGAVLTNRRSPVSDNRAAVSRGVV